MFSKYEYVYQVYKEKSFTKAAEKLLISQPSLSAAIKNIEKKVGAELFERAGSGIKLTEIGEEYIAATEKIIKAENEFKNRINDIYNIESGKVTVGGSNHLSSYVLPKIINHFTSLHPKIDVTLMEANSNNLKDMIKNEQVDLFIDSFDETMDEYEKYPLVDERILLCVPKDNKINDDLKEFQINPDNIYDGSVDLNSMPSVSIEKFKDEKFILLKNGNDMYERAMYLFHHNNITPNVIFTVDQLNISYALADSGMGLCFVTDTFFKYRKFSTNVLLYSLGKEHCSRILYIVHKRNKYCTRAMSEFIKVTKEIISK